MGPNRPKTFMEAGQRLAAAYASYAAGAQSVSGDSPSSLTGPEAILRTALQAAFANNRADPASTAANLAVAFTSFWLAPPVVFTGPPVSAIVTGVIGTTILQAGLLTQWAANVAARATAQQTAAGLTTLLDVFSHTVLVLHVFPAPAPPVVAPIL